MFTLFKDMKSDDRFVALLALCIFTLFSIVAITSMFMPIKVDGDIKQTVIALVMLAAGFYLGSSAGSKKKDDTIGDIAKIPIAPIAPVAPVAPVDPIVQPE